MAQTVPDEWHGTWRGYQTAKCKCTPCKTWYLKHRGKRSRDPESVAQELPMSVNEKIAEIEFLGLSDTVDNIAQRLGWNFYQMKRELKRKGRHDLAQWLTDRRNSEQAWRVTE